MPKMKIDPEIPNLKEEVKQVLTDKVEINNFNFFNFTGDYLFIGFKHFAD